MAYDPRRWLSVSAWKSLGDCAERYRIVKVEKIPEAPAAWTVRGIAVHSAIEEWERSTRSIDPLQYFEDVAWPKALEQTTSKFPDYDQWLKMPRVGSVKRDLELRKKESPEHIERYVLRALSEENDWRVWNMPLPVQDDVDPHIYEMPAVEVEFKLEFPEFILVGWIDQIIEWWDGETYTVKDVKTGNGSKEDDRQLGVYKYAANRMFNLGITHGSYHYTKLDRDSGLKNLDIYTEELLREVFNTVNSQIKAKLFLPNPEKDKCEMFCGVRKHCRLYKESA